MKDGETMRSRKLVMEGIVIVLSILLAFAIDAYWEERQEASNTRQSIEVVRRDLVDSLEQLDEFDQFSAEIARASVEAARALAESEPVATADRPQIESLLQRSVFRRTMRLPRAGYTDLLSTGNLAEIDNAALRNSIVQFYEATDRRQEIIEKNSAIFTDKILHDAIFTSGLLIPMPREGDSFDSINLLTRRNQIYRELIGLDFPTRPARLWRLPMDSPEVDRIVSALLQNARTASTAQVIAQERYSKASELIRQLDEYLGDN
jgi:hypothetical protein